MAFVFLKDDIIGNQMIIENHMISIGLREEIPNWPLHTHDFLELSYICKGSAIHHYNGKQITISKGDFFFIDYNSEHRMIVDHDKVECITCTFVPEFIDTALLGCRRLSDIFHNFTINVFPISLNGNYSFHDRSGKVLNILEQMIEEYQKKESGYLSFLRTYLIQLILLALRTVDIHTEATDERIIEITHYIHEHYNEKISLGELCRKYYCTPSNISILFKSQVGLTFTDYLRKIRMESACRLLINSHNSIDRIATDVGYNDVKTFRKHFKAYFGHTPQFFRKKYRPYRTASAREFVHDTDPEQAVENKTGS